MNKSKNGSIMIAALIIAILTGSLVGVFLKTVTQEIENAHRSRMALLAINISEAGLEQALYCLQKETWPSTYWKSSGDAYYGTPFVNNFGSLRQERKSVKVYIDTSSMPYRAVSEGTITKPNDIVVVRQVYIELGSRSLFANGLLANVIDLNGKNVEADAYDSRLNGGLYDETLNRIDECSVSCYSLDAGDIVIGNADVYGNVATGSNDITELIKGIGPQGSITGSDTPSGTKVDLTRIATDFYADLDYKDQLEPTSPSSFNPATDTIMGTDGTTTIYEFDADDDPTGDVVLSIDQPTTVYGNVILVVDGSLDVNHTVTLDANASLTIYVSGDVDISGNNADVINASGLPTNLTVFGTGLIDPDTGKAPEIKIAGNGAFYGAVYAPDYTVHLGGGGSVEGEVYGSIVANLIKFNGKIKFHYDVALADKKDEDAYKVSRWVELTDATQRKNMATILSDGL